MSDESTDENSDDELAELEGVVRGPDGRIRARMARTVADESVSNDD